jgi:hypothetical protein
MASIRIDTNVSRMAEVLYSCWEATQQDVNAYHKHMFDWDDLSEKRRSFWYHMARNLIKAYILGSSEP